MIHNFFQQTGSVIDRFASVRKLYDVLNVQNKIVDGTIPFPEDRQKARGGLSVEFRYVASRN